MALGAVSASAETASFTEAECTNWAVPSGVHELTVTAVGEAGQPGLGEHAGIGGPGDEVTAKLQVTPEEALDVCEPCPEDRAVRLAARPSSMVATGEM